MVRKRLNRLTTTVQQLLEGVVAPDSPTHHGPVVITTYTDGDGDFSEYFMLVEAHITDHITGMRLTMGK